MHQFITTLLLMLLRNSDASMSDIDCGKGMVRDLDGTCVKKVVLPKSKESCPKLAIDNGEIFVIGSRMVQFYCDTGFVRVPDTEIAICQVTGRWSKVVPACLMPGCQAPPAPANGEVNLLMEFEDSVAVFSCNSGHILTGATVLGCLDGEKWNGTVPECKEVASDQPFEGTDTSSSAQFNHVVMHLILILMSSQIMFTSICSNLLMQ